MASDWIELSLSELTTKITKGTTPTKKDGGFSREGINYIKSEAVTFDGRIDESKFTFISSEIHKKLKRSQLEESDILMSMAGIHLGKTAIVRTRHLPANTNQALALIRPIKNKIYPDYLFYFLQQSSVVYFINNSTSQSAQPNINLQEIGSLNIKFPLLAEQKAIAHILGSLDNKIELNRQMNETLEAMAQALFKSWFVDFDPVIDNALAAGNAIPDEFIERAEQRKGIEKKENSDIQGLFPDEFEFTEEMGWIPKEWAVRNLTEIADFQNGFAFYTTGYSETGYKVVDLANIHTDGRFIETHRDKHVSPEIYNLPKHEKHRLYKDDIVMAMTDMTQAMGILGKCGKIYESNKYILNQRIGKIRAKEDVNINFLLTYLNSDYQLSFLKTRVLGTVQKYINTTHIKEMNFIIPQAEVMDRFGNIVDPQFNKMREADEENENLVKLRDTLLPKLLSGELRIPDAAEWAEEI